MQDVRGREFNKSAQEKISESVNHIDCILFALNNLLKLEKLHTSQMWSKQKRQTREHSNMPLPYFESVPFKTMSHFNAFLPLDTGFSMRNWLL